MLLGRKATNQQTMAKGDDNFPLLLEGVVCQLCTVHRPVFSTSEGGLFFGSGFQMPHGPLADHAREDLAETCLD